MKISTTLSAAMVLALLANSAQAAIVTIFPVRDTFENTVPVKLFYEGFEDVTDDVSFGGGSVTVGEVTLRGDSQDSLYNQVDVVPFRPEVNVDGSNAASFFVSPTQGASITMANPVTYWGADFRNFNVDSESTAIVINGEKLVNIGFLQSLAFIGVESDTPFTRIDFVGITENAFGIDNITYGFAAPVPLPAGGLLLLTGLAGVAAMRRKSKR